MAKKKRIQRTISLLPNLLSVASLFLGFVSILSSIRGEYTLAVVYIMFAAVADMLDGRVARITKSEGPLGAQLDSLTDATSFGLAPALLAYLWMLQDIQPAGLIIAFFFFVCGVVRLARFNVLAVTRTKAITFEGLPVPSAAGCSMSFYLFVNFLGVDRMLPFGVEWLVGGLMLTLGFLMISTVPYRSLTDFDVIPKRAAYLVPLFAVTIALIVHMWQVMMFIVAVVYLVGGLLDALLPTTRKRPVSGAGPGNVARLTSVGDKHEQSGSN